MTGRGLITTVQEFKGKYTTPIPMALINLLGIKKGDTFIWNLDNDKAIKLHLETNQYDKNNKNITIRPKDISKSR
jgi:hypothetical protein